MKKLLFIILLISSLFALSCNNNDISGSLYTGPIGKVGEIIVDPYKMAPLSAIYTTEKINTAPITVTVKGLYGEPDIIHTYPSGYGTEFEIHGMFPDSENTIIVNDGGKTITKNVTVGTISHNGITIQNKYNVINNLPEEKYPNNPELYFSEHDYGFTIGISRNGYTRYFITFNSSKIVVHNKKLYLYPNWGNKIINLLGETIINYPKGAHHDTIKINNDYIYCSAPFYGSQQEGLTKINSSGEQIDTDRSVGTLIKDIVYKNNDPNEIEIFKKIVFGSAVDNYLYNNVGQVINVDWFHANSLVYDSETDILYISGRNRGVLAIDYSDWELIWWMADETLATIGIPYDLHFKHLPSLEPYRLKGDAINDGPKNQHALFLFPNGNLGMFDNGGDQGNPLGSRYVEYKITGSHGNWTAEKVDQYNDPNLYSQSRSDVDLVGENHQNLLITYATGKVKILEIEKSSKKVLFELDLPMMAYRSDKMPLYYDEGRVYSEDCNLKNPN